MAVYYSGGGGFPWAKLLGMAAAPLTGGVPLLSLFAPVGGAGGASGVGQQQDAGMDELGSLTAMPWLQPIAPSTSQGQQADDEVGILDLAAAPWSRYLPSRRR